MKPKSEIKDQQVFEGDAFSAEDEQLYHLLFQELDKAPELEIKPEFSESILKKLELRKRKESRTEVFLFGFAIVGVMMIAVLAASFAKRALQSSPDFIKDSPLAPAMAFAGLLILFQFVDKRYLRDARIRRKLKSS